MAQPVDFMQVQWIRPWFRLGAHCDAALGNTRARHTQTWIIPGLNWSPGRCSISKRSWPGIPANSCGWICAFSIPVHSLTSVSRLRFRAESFELAVAGRLGRLREKGRQGRGFDNGTARGAASEQPYACCDARSGSPAQAAAPRARPGGGPPGGQPPQTRSRAYSDEGGKQRHCTWRHCVRPAASSTRATRRNSSWNPAPARSLAPAGPQLRPNSHLQNSRRESESMASTPKREVAESSFDFLHYSIVDTFSRHGAVGLRACPMETHIPALSPVCLPGLPICMSQR